MHEILSNDNCEYSDKNTESEDEDTESNGSAVSEDEVEFIEKQEDIGSTNKVVNKWNSFLEEEEEAISELNEDTINELNEDTISELNEDIISGKSDFNGHPAVALNAKWKLVTLFDKNSFKHPPYMNLLTQ
ncbi:4043_t:CDS:1 [Dentiscutata erythropus]|uniref:4043_t:CDS:1 n=1 Tax=Dentiscutata erythropus TaxID=1348616 RepID=A0A9N9HM40_9GLOM|nr:4043_t:CDS:1 [Dentiscutata erythropus]